ncbi:hypothetical protein JCM1840_005514 [Sporobolomyces johnsonii]
MLPGAWGLLSYLSSLVSLAQIIPVDAYIPALPVNDTANLVNSDDMLHLAFYDGVFNTAVSKQLWADSFDAEGNYTNATTVVPWTRYSKGVLIHFDEALRDQPPAAVPWLAMISCDTNGTSYSEVDDIFTICRDLGAQAALLYSLHSQGCQINEEYLVAFEKVLDVYATTSLQSSRIIESQFVNVATSAYEYNSTTLNASSTLIDALLASNALSVNGNVAVNSSDAASSGSATLPTATDGSVATSTLEPTAMDSAQTSPSVFDPNGPDSSGDGEATSTDPSLFSSSDAASLRLRNRFGKRQATSSAAASTSSSRSSGAPIESPVSSSSRRSSASRTSSAATPTQTQTTNYLGAVIAAANNTVGGLYTSATPSATTTNSSGGGGGSNTGLAMIILYAITGVVTFLFLIVIVAGAIRVIKHPERYGPRAGFGYSVNRSNGAAGDGAGAGGAGGGGQTRAQGLARAVLDTFPVVRFGGGGAEARRDEEVGAGAVGEEGKKEDEEVEMSALAPAVPFVAATTTHDSAGRTGVGAEGHEDEDEVEEVASTREKRVRRSTSSSKSFHSASSSVPVPLLHRRSSTNSLSSYSAASPILSSSVPISAPLAASASLEPSPSYTSQPSEPDSVLPATTAGVPTNPSDALSCPICVCDFAPGEEVRILPCDQRHQFHRECIDPWLLGVSRLCPLCRLDLGASTSASATGGAEEGDDGRTSEERERERERNEEERVVRHLRALLNRGSVSASASASGSGSATAGDATPVAEPGGGGMHARETSAQSAGTGTGGLRSRFARYVAVRRRTGGGSEGGGGLRIGRRTGSSGANALLEAEGVAA